MSLRIKRPRRRGGEEERRRGGEEGIESKDPTHQFSQMCDQFLLPLKVRRPLAAALVACLQLHREVRVQLFVHDAERAVIAFHRHIPEIKGGRVGQGGS